MENETQKTVPILEIAWTRYAQLNAAAKRRSTAYKRLRLWIAALGILATFFAILTQEAAASRVPIPALLTLVIRAFFIAIPIIASVLAAFGTRAFRNADWLITRAAAEEYMKEIFLYRTIWQNKKNRGDALEKQIKEIQERLYRGLGGELVFQPYEGPIPPHYDPNNPDSDPGYSDLNGEQYLKHRLDDQLRWHQRRILDYKRERGILTFLVLAAGGLGAFFAAWGGPISIWVALTASVTAALIGWQELRNIDSVIKNYSKVILELTNIYNHWMNLEPEERTRAEFHKMVRGTENVLWAQSTEYINFMQEALKDASLQEEAATVERVIEESKQSAKRMKQTMQDDLVQFTQETLGNVEVGVTQTFQGVL
ncbi:MAG TPA: SLATT domain-containing protein, partial [Anaerolineales bacterium]|nr:SLATT domain-containing protein [Anaerolineales bacterium]